jgi:hypothetical protein
MHYKPEIPLLKGAGNPYFPDHCLGSGCAQWAVTSAKAFADAYFAMLQINPNYARLYNTWPAVTDVIGPPATPEPST